MNRRRTMLLCLAVSILATYPGFADAAGPADWPTRWQVNADGVEGILEFSIRDDGSLIGRLLDAEFEGYVAGRHLFLHRTGAERVEVWEGWVGQGDKPIVAGTISVETAGETVISPWFGMPAEASSPSPTSPVVPPPVAEPPSAAAPTPAAVPPPVPPPPSDGSLSGTWATAGGERIEIVQTGNVLSVTRSDGSSHSGRITGSSTFVVGLGKGCCSGTLDGPNVIEWSDGARWRRTN